MHWSSLTWQKLTNHALKLADINLCCVRQWRQDQPRPSPQPEIASKSAKTARLITGGRYAGMAMDLCVGL
jgi:hypothetical protein